MTGRDLLGRSADRRRVGLLGGSFNPAHEGHREISLLALERLGLDAVWWLVTPGNPLKDPGLYAPYEDRLATARRVAGHPHIVISDFERRRGLQYTIDTLDALTALNAHTAFVWIMGADAFAQFDRWKDWRRIAALVPLAVFNRPGFAAEALSGPAAESLAPFRIPAGDAMTLAAAEPPAWVYFDDTAIAMSSTAIRAGRPGPA